MKVTQVDPSLASHEGFDICVGRIGKIIESDHDKRSDLPYRVAGIFLPDSDYVEDNWFGEVELEKASPKDFLIQQLLDRLER